LVCYVAQVFLQHLGPLSSLPTFTALWLTILDFLAQFISTASSDLLADALPESLKNMLLVMDTSGRTLFFTGKLSYKYSVTFKGTLTRDCKKKRNFFVTNKKFFL
jgi:hypothetical protein